jgi:hypothetical protein
MCNRFLNKFTLQIAEKALPCSCLSIQNHCSGPIDFQISNKQIRDIFLHGYFQNFQLLKLYNSTREFVDMAMCYLHENDLYSFFDITQLLYYEDYKVEDINESRILLKQYFIHHLKCLPLNIFDNKYVYVGFGTYNTLDILEEEPPQNSRKYGHYDEYITVSLKIWLYVLFSETCHRSYFYEIFKKITDENVNPLTYSLDIPFSQLLSLSTNHEISPSKMLINTPSDKNNIITPKENFVETLIRNISCSCNIEKHKLCKAQDKSYVYSPKNIRDIIANFKTPQYGRNIDYSSVIDGRITKSTFLEEFIHVAICYFHEENFVEIFRIISAALLADYLIESLKKYISPHINCVSKKSMSKYKININVKTWKIKIFLIKDQNIQTIFLIKDQNTQTRYFMKDMELKRNKYYGKRSGIRLNISFTQWINDVLYNKNYKNKWTQIWKNTEDIKL